jgi:hypothetical protein
MTVGLLNVIRDYTVGRRCAQDLELLTQYLGWIPVFAVSKPVLPLLLHPTGLRTSTVVERQLSARHPERK